VGVEFILKIGLFAQTMSLGFVSFTFAHIKCPKFGQNFAKTFNKIHGKKHMILEAPNYKLILILYRTVS
jgi:hypothetical protein